MKCPVCRVKNGKPHRLGCPDAPLDPTTHLARVEEWAGTVNARLAALEAPQAYPDGAPPGVVSPHVRANLEALEAWSDPKRWGIGGGDAEMRAMRHALETIQAKIAVAIAGGDVPHPDTPAHPPQPVRPAPRMGP